MGSHVSDLDPRVVAQFASKTHTRTKADGTVLTWKQEPESDVKIKEEAVAQMQRTIDFWLPQLIDDVAKKHGITRVEAVAIASRHFRTSTVTMLEEPFPVKWGVTMDDLNFNTIE